MKTLFLAWQDPRSRRWFPVGKLSYKKDEGIYRFVYTKGAKVAPNFMPLGHMKDLTAIYESEELFPLFANRLMSSKRPEYQNFLHWLDLQEDEADPIALLARTEGIRETDSLTVFPCPEPDLKGKYQVHFFSHGVRHLPDHAIQIVNQLQPGAPLYLMPDPQNPYDTWAMALRTDDPATIVGYCPRYLAKDFLNVLVDSNPTNVKVKVVRVNIDAPIQLRLLCGLEAYWPEGFEPCSGELFEELAENIPQSTRVSPAI
jgi:hypothetical protein